MMKTTKQNEQLELLAIDAAPTKELFINMLTRDVALIPAIIDLADNSTDGARRERPDGNWKQLEVRIDVAVDRFSIVDTCGGITVDAARHYAFRFGRPTNSPLHKGDVGRFGVGMKRGLFKIGRHFVITSTTATSSFTVTIDVETWAKQKAWDFHFDQEPVEGGSFPREKRGTSIIVTQLHQGVSEHFSEREFLAELRQELNVKLESSIQKGMAVIVNGTALKTHIRQLVADAQLAPARVDLKLKGLRRGKVTAELWCGIGKAESKDEARREAGWYVFCNGRMLLEADKTSQTGWGETDSETIPGFHPQYNDFRGFVYLDADDAADLPWNTTKTALDTDHPIYRHVRHEMINLGRPVINFLNKVKQEIQTRKEAGDEHPGPLEAMVTEAHMKPLSKLTPRRTFTLPRVKASKAKGGQKPRHICFDVPEEQAVAAREQLGVSSWKEVGREVFDYFYQAECGDE